MTEHVFTTGDPLIVRITTRPAGSAATTRIDLRPDDEGYAERLLAYLRTVADDPALREGVDIASPALGALLDRAVAGERLEVKKAQRAALSVTRYLLRMSGRPTPFGVFAGVALARFDESAKVRLGQAHQRGVRADAGWLAEVVDRWEQVPAVRDELRVVVNELCFVRGGRLVLPYVPRSAAPDEPGSDELSIRCPAPIRATLALARAPIGYRAVLDALDERFPTLPRAGLDTMLGQLVANEILLTDLRPPLDETDGLRHLLDHPASAAAPDRPALVRVRERLADYAATPLGRGREQWQNATRAMARIVQTQGQTVQVDLRADIEVRLPKAVADEVAAAADALLALGVPRHPAPNLIEYQSAFIERYGTSRLVPVTELLDPEAGLGAPAGYQVPAGHRSVASETPPDFEVLRAGLAAAALRDDANEVELTDELLDQLTPTPSGTVPPSIDACFSVLARSMDALNSGQFQLLATPVGAARAAGNIGGRFAYLFDPAEFAAVTALDADPDGVPRAELRARPLRPRGGNVIQVPSHLPYHVPVATFADSSEPTTLSVRDLAVGANRDRMYVVSTTLGREIRPTSSHMLNDTTNSPNVLRLLREIGDWGVRPVGGWRWGAVGALPKLPRVRRGRTILSPARWRIDPDLREKSLSLAEWTEVLDRWRRRWQVPDRVVAQFADNRITLDLTVPLHRQVLRHDCLRQHRLIIMEAPDDRDWGWLDGHANEIAVPLRATASQQRTHLPTPSPAALRTPPRYLPGREWISARLYASEGLHDEILTEHLPALLDQVCGQVDRWFFVRYHDDRAHLRIRFHGVPDALNGHVLPALNRWASALVDSRLSSELVLGVYEPELVRYGGEQAIDAAERLFTADSEAVLTQLRLRRAGQTGAVTDELLVAANYVDLLRGTGDPNWLEWVVATYPKDEEHHRAFTAIRDRAIRLLDLTGDWSELTAGTDPTLCEPWPARGAAMGSYAATLRDLPAQRRNTALTGVLHMHHNRLAGINRRAEGRSQAIARAVAKTAIQRARRMS